MTRRSFRQSRDAEAGFTLLELLMAMTVLALLMTLTFGGLTFGARAWERTLQTTSDALDLRASQALLRNALGHAYPRLVVKGTEAAFVDFDGSPTRVKFLARPPQVFAAGGRASFDLRADTQGGRTKLIVAIRPEIPGAQARPIAEDILLDDVKSISFSYFGSLGPQETETWRDTWQNRMNLPKLVRVHIEFPDGDTRIWPDLFVATQIAVDVSCNYDPVSKSCADRQ